MNSILISILTILEKIVAVVPTLSKWLRQLIFVLAEKKAKFYSKDDFTRYSENYIDPFCQDSDPGYGLIDSNKRIDEEIELLEKSINELIRNKEKYIIILGDTGTGKTAFLVNYYLNKSKKIFSRYRFHINRLNYKNLDSYVNEISNKKKSVILLDALDEDIQAIDDYHKRIIDLCEFTKGFRTVIMTCRTQFFSSSDELPNNTTIRIDGPTSLGEKKTYLFKKKYMLPFSDLEIKKFLDVRFKGRKNRKVKEQAFELVEKYSASSIFTRPMIVERIDLFLNGEVLKYTFQFYEIIIDNWLEREKFVFGSNDDKEASRKFVDNLAIELMTRRVELGAELLPFNDVAPLAKKFNVELADWKLTSRSILNRDSDDNFKFAHRSFAEYLFVRGLFKTRIEDTPKMDKWTGEMARFFLEYVDYVQSSKEPVNIYPNKIDLERISEIKEIEHEKVELFENKQFSLAEIKSIAIQENEHFWIKWDTEENEHLAFDFNTHLLWQCVPTQITAFRDIEKLVNKFNEEVYGGYNDWRLPYVNEVITFSKAILEEDIGIILTSSIASPSAAEEEGLISTELPIVVHLDSGGSIYRPSSTAEVLLVKSIM